MSLRISRKGILFTFMSLLLILSLLSLVDSLNSQRSSLKANAALVYSLNSTSSRFDNVYSDFVFLDKDANARLVDQRNLPFSYSMDYNSLSIVQELPLRISVWNNYFDLVNAYVIFLKDSNTGFSSEFAVDANTVKNAIWGGSVQDLNFVLLPQCLFYDVNSSLYSAGFYSASFSGCSFDSSKIGKYSVIVSLKSPAVEDYNSITYNIPGFSNPANPAFEFLLLDNNCAKCSLSQASKSIIGYFDPTQSGWITVKCVGALCHSKDINIFVSSGLQAFHSGERVDVNFTVKFKNFIDSFYFKDFNASVTNNDFNIVYSNA
ncbi:MAG: hypothetical protein Q7R70_03140 [Candidatus Diapherotrites archaeon]|nr:hypothetical protein [Candidatus Diapherotrites archaeon]